MIRFLAAGLIKLLWAATKGIRTRPRAVAVLAGHGLPTVAAELGLATLALARVPSAAAPREATGRRHRMTA